MLQPARLPGARLSEHPRAVADTQKTHALIRARQKSGLAGQHDGMAAACLVSDVLGGFKAARPPWQEEMMAWD